MQRILLIAVLSFAGFLINRRAVADEFSIPKATQAKVVRTGSKWEVPSWSRLFWEIAPAPKVLYDVQTLEVFRNGVWVDFSVTNESSKKLYFDANTLNVPVEYMELLDSRDIKWKVPHFEGNITLRPPDEFVLLEPGRTVKFRSKLSVVNKPLETAKVQHEPPKDKPSHLNYKIATWWGQVYSELTQDDMKELQVFAIGNGKARAKWVDRDYPLDWAFQQRK